MCVRQSSEVLSPGCNTQVVRLPHTAVYCVQLHHVSHGTTRHSFVLFGRCDNAHYFVGGRSNCCVVINSLNCELKQGLPSLTAQRAACETSNVHPSYRGSVPLGPKFYGNGVDNVQQVVDCTTILPLEVFLDNKTL